MFVTNYLSLVVLTVLSSPGVFSLDEEDPGVSGLNHQGLLDQYDWTDVAPTIKQDDILVEKGYPCVLFYDSLCGEVQVGQGKAASCLRDKLKSIEQVAGQGDKAMCEQDIALFFESVRSDVTLFNARLAAQCAAELEYGVCQNTAKGNDGDSDSNLQTPFACLKHNKEQLSLGCQDEVFKEEIEEEEDPFKNGGLLEACRDDITNHYCEFSAPENLKDCLQAPIEKSDWESLDHQLSETCAKFLLGEMIEESTDIRLNVKLDKACQKEIEGFCSQISFGDGAVRDCLFEKRTSLGFQETCRAAIEGEMALEAKDSRLDAAFTELCAEEMDRLCLSEKETTDASTSRLDGSLLKCMLNNLDSIQSAGCKAEVVRLGEVKSEFFNADVEVEHGCAQDVLAFCAGIEDETKIQICLRTHLNQLSESCRRAEFAELIEEKQALELKPTLLRNCEAELIICADVDHCAVSNNWETVDSAECGLNCLREMIADTNLNVKKDLNTVNFACVDEVNTIEQEESTDYRLMAGVEMHCMSDIDTLCAMEKTEKGEDGSGPVGVVVQCLVKHRHEIMDLHCVDIVNHIVEMKEETPTNDAFTERACGEDEDFFCPQLEGSALHDCLLDHFTFLEPMCRDVEFEDEKAAFENIDFNPAVKNFCATEIKTLCEDALNSVQIFRCLEDVYVQSHQEDQSRSSDESFNSDPSESVQVKQPVAAVTSNKGVKGSGVASSSATLPAAASGGVTKGFGSSLNTHHPEGLTLPKVPKSLMPSLNVNSKEGKGNDKSSGSKSNNAKWGNNQNKVNKGNNKGGVGRYLRASRKLSSFSGARSLSSSSSSSLSRECDDTLSALIEEKNNDYRLSPELVQDCAWETNQFCRTERDIRDRNGPDVEEKGDVISCLIDHRDAILDPGCYNSLKRKMVQRVFDGFDDPQLRADCETEISTLCYDISPGAGNLNRCLFSDNYYSLSEQCKKREISIQELKAEDVDLNPLLVEHCQPVLVKYCSKVPDSEKMACLENHMETSETTAACRSRVMDEPILRSKSILLNPDLKSVCEDDLHKLEDARACQSVVNYEALGYASISESLNGEDIQCLLDNEQVLTGACQLALVNVKRDRAKDIRANPEGINVCVDDIDKYCSDETYGDGEMNRCLQRHLNGNKKKNKLSDACARLQYDILKDETMDFFANPFMEIACSEEKDKYCSTIKDGQARIQTCLASQLKRNKASISAGCQQELENEWISAKYVELFVEKMHPTGLTAFSFFRSAFHFFIEYHIFYFIELLLLALLFCGLTFGSFVLFLKYGSPKWSDPMIRCHAKYFRWFNRVVRNKKHDPFQS